MFEEEAEERFWVKEMEVGMEVKIVVGEVLVGGEVKDWEEVWILVRVRRREEGRVGMNEGALMLLGVCEDGADEVERTWEVGTDVDDRGEEAAG